MPRNIQDTFIAPHCSEAIKLCYEDEYILVIDKPSGLLSLSGKNPLNADSVHARLVKQWPEALMVHRLDFGTSGLIVVARSKAVATQLNKQFQAKTVKKTYQAVLFGLLEQDSGVIDAAIARDDENFPKMKIGAEGKTAQTHYQVLERDEERSTARVEYSPMTGRTHQLRIHSAHIGHPILGCDIYGNEQSQSQAERLLLHATGLSFSHPNSGEPMVFHSLCPF
jgi:tRNA pseudouridine32 synthase/23S rRNA pseudouridine746 synthase